MIPELSALSLREQAAQLVWPRIGSNMPPPQTVAEDAARAEALLNRCPFGGLVLFNGDTVHTPELLSRLQQRSRVPLLIGSDLERGAGQQLRGATFFPHAMAFAAPGVSLEDVALLARTTALEALRCGVQVIFAPVADVNRNPNNPIIATRAFGWEPDEVAARVAAYVRAALDAGALPVAKHFPGHGNTAEDSHATLPVVPGSRAELETTDLVPFREAIAAGVPLVMSAHVAYPALDASGLPATLSRPILTRLLRAELAFPGAVITDSLLMAAIREGMGSMADFAAALLNAGADILLDPPEPEALVQGIIDAVEAGAITRERLSEAAGRVLALKSRLDTRFGADVFCRPERLFADVSPGADAEEANRIARQSITLTNGTRELPDLDPEALMVLLVRPNRSRLDPPKPPMQAAVAQHLPGARFIEVGPEASPSDLDALADEAKRFRARVVALAVRPAAWHAYGLPEAQQRFVQQLTAVPGTVVASLGTPGVLDAFPGASARLCAWSDAPASQAALIERLAGR